MFKWILRAAVPVGVVILTSANAAAASCPAYTYVLSNGTTADATQVMQNFTTIRDCADNALAPLAGPSFTGSVGIGTVTPAETLDVNGNIKISAAGGELKLTNAFTPNNVGYLRMANWNHGAESLVANLGDGNFWVFTDDGGIYYDDGGSLGTGLHLTSAGLVSIGTPVSAGVALTVSGDIRTGSSGTNGCVQNFAGTALAGTCSSDAALKTVIGNVTGVLGKVAELQLVRFYWNSTAASVYHDVAGVANTGFIAQQVEQRFPELVTHDAHGYRQLDYTTLSLYGLEAIKELKLDNDAKAAQIAVLKARLDDDERELGAIKVRLGLRTAAADRR
jgi:hypothetical protein